MNVGIPQTELEQTYSWLRNGTAVYGPIGGNGGNQSLKFSMDANRAGTYIVESTKPGCDTVFSNNVYVYYGGVTNLMTTSVCPTSVSFSWQDYNNPIKAFQYFVSESPTPPSIGIFTSTTSITVGSLNPGAIYRIHVRGASIPNLDIASLSFCNDWTTITFITPSAIPTPTLSPSSASFCQGGSQLLTATGGDTYLWSLNGTTITGANSNTYNATLPGTYRVYAYISGCNQASTSSNTSVITVTALPTGTITPGNATICSGSSQLLTATSGTAYQWSRNGTPISGATAATYSATLAGTYSVLITNNGCSAAASNTSSITVTALPTGTIIPANATICAGSSQLLTATGGTAYQWSRNGTPISGATSATYSATLAGTYSVLITNNGCSAAASNTSSITVTALPTGTIIPANATICSGSSQLLTATGGTSYQWSRNGTPISGATAATYSATLAGTYSVLITNNGCSAAASNISRLQLPALPTGTIIPANATICSGSSQLLTATGGTAYQWSRNGIPISGATSATYSATLAGTYSVAITNNGCSAAATNTATIIVNPVTTSTTNISICNNQLPYSWNGNIILQQVLIMLH